MQQCHAEVIVAVGVTRLAKALGEKPKTVDGWKNRNSIPGNRYIAVADACRCFGVDVSVEVLARMAAGLHPNPSASHPVDAAPAAALPPQPGAAAGTLPEAVA